MSDGPRGADIESLAPYDRLSLLIGRVCQADVWLEFNLRHLWMSLAGLGPALYVMPDQFGPLHQQCKVMTTNAEMEERLREAGSKALVQSKAEGQEQSGVQGDQEDARRRRRRGDGPLVRDVPDSGAQLRA